MAWRNSVSYPREDWYEKSFSNGDLGMFINQAKALSALFDCEFAAGYSPIQSVNTSLNCKELCDRHELDERHSTNLAGVARRLTKIKQITDFLIGKYGLDEKGKINNPKAVYHEIHFTKAPEKIEAWPSAFAIGFSLPRKTFKRGKKGEAAGSTQFYLLPDVVLDEIIDGLEQRRYHKSKKNIAWKLNTEVFEAADEKLKKKIAEQGVSKEEVSMHEQKHIADQLICPPFYIARELSAHFFSNPLPQRVHFERTRSCDYISFNCSPDTKDKIEKFPLENIEAMTQNGLSLRELSFVVSTTNCYELPERLTQLGDYFKT